MKLATLCYLKRDGKTLMLHRVKKENDVHQGKWNGLGGKMEPGETPEECAVREIREECGLDARRPALKGILTFPGFKDDEDWYEFVFVVTDFSGELTDSAEGHLKWIPDTDIPSLNLWEGDRSFLKWMDEGSFFSGKFIYKNGKLQEQDVVFH